jgi:hypothetical protein
MWHHHLGSSAAISPRAAPSDDRRLRAMIDQATWDSEDESDEHAGLLSTIREEVACPFRARLDGEDVECTRLDWPPTGYGLNAVCNTRSGSRVVDIRKLEWVEPYPRGHDWIEAYFAWRDLVG